MITQTTAKHTPGPWSYNRDEGGYHGHVISTADYIICDLPDMGEGAAPHIESNARLIVAAPDLFAALQLIAEMIDPYSLNKQGREARAQTLRAIAKAEGR